MPPTNKRPAWLPMLPLLLLSAMFCACSSTQYVASPCPLVPPLPPEALQPPTPPDCSPSCSSALTTELRSWRQLLTSAALPAQPASTPTKP